MTVSHLSKLARENFLKQLDDAYQSLKDIPDYSLLMTDNLTMHDIPGVLAAREGLYYCDDNGDLQFWVQCAQIAGHDVWVDDVGSHHKTRQEAVVSFMRAYEYATERVAEEKMVHMSDLDYLTRFVPKAAEFFSEVDPYTSRPRYRVHSLDTYRYHNPDSSSLTVVYTVREAQYRVLEAGYRSLHAGDAVRLALEHPEEAQTLLALFDSNTRPAPRPF